MQQEPPEIAKLDMKYVGNFIVVGEGLDDFDARLARFHELYHIASRHAMADTLFARVREVCD